MSITHIRVNENKTLCGENTKFLLTTSIGLMCTCPKCLEVGQKLINNQKDGVLVR